MIASGPVPEARAGVGLQPSGERKLVTVVLLDVMAPSPSLDPEQMRLELDRCAWLAAEVLESWGGTVERLVGGSVLAVFGVPTAHEDDAGRALRAGLELLERSPAPVRVGVGTGEVITPVGTPADLREIAGAALDVAGRLKEVAEPGAVMAAERTCRVAGASLEFAEPVRLVDASGRELGARRLVGLASTPSADQPRLQGPMIGREAELGVVLNLFDEVVASGQPRLLTVVGSAGVGKSRLVGEAVAAMVARGTRRNGPARPLPVRGPRHHLLGAGRDPAPGVRCLARRPAGHHAGQVLDGPPRDPRPAGVIRRGGRHRVRARGHLWGQPA
jgi:class 3 adenylate cyclase